jgi:hemoglobin-like flavoprotein
MVDYEEIFNESYWRTLDRVKSGVGFFDAFYQCFIETNPDIKEKFKHTNMENQKLMLKNSLVHMSSFYVEKIADEYMENISKVHSKVQKDIPAYMYDLWLDCLIETVKDYDPDFNQDVELAWRLVMASGIVYMRFNYDK